ncbi:MAG: hypothetical protein KGL39_16395 [Patescibacteria group bacterium]|nr:hypothetical protein [Patescibacteria group bacterium]
MIDRLPMIIVEGMDNTGKTSLTQYLGHRYGLPVIHSEGPRGVIESFKWVESAMNLHKNNIIYDRFPLVSEEVYGVVLRNYSVFDNPPGEELRHRLVGAKPILIFCRPPLDVMGRFGEREQMEGVIENSIQLSQRYEEVIFGEFSEIDPISFDYSSDPDYTNLITNFELRLVKGGFVA